MSPIYSHKTEKKRQDRQIIESIDALLEVAQLLPETREFLISLKNHYKRKGGLTSRQYEVLLEVEESLEEEGQKVLQKWIDEYDEKKKETAEICANYYIKTKYYYDLAKKILQDRDYILSERSYRAMCENGYAKKVLNASRASPKYPAGTIVQIRKTVGGNLIKFKNMVATVIETDHKPVLSAAVGGKQYKILPFGQEETIDVEERHVKKYRKKA